MFEIRKVSSTEAELVSALAIKSKAYWGYDKEFMDSCIDELSHSEAQISNERFLLTLRQLVMGLGVLYLSTPKTLQKNAVAVF